MVENRADRDEIQQNVVFLQGLQYFQITVKLVLNGHSKIGKTYFFKTDGSLVQVKSISECSSGAF